MDDYKGLTAAIVTGCDEKYAPLMLDLCDSLGPWRRYLHVIDVGLSAETHDKLALREVKVHTLPDGLFGPTSPPSNFHRIVFARTRLPDLFAADILMWIDADCWTQRPEAIAVYLDSAAKHPDDFTLCAVLDVDYPRCLDNYWPYLQIYHEQYRTLFGRKVANSLLGKAVLSSGVFAARRTSPMWRAWHAEILKAFASRPFRRRPDIRFMADMLTLNAVLHRSHNYRVLNSEMNWLCHCSDLEREGDVVRILPSRRIPAILHLADQKSAGVEARYREKRLFYERPTS